MDQFTPTGLIQVPVTATTVTYSPRGEDPIEFDLLKLPADSITKLIRLGLTYYFGSNVSAKLSAEQKRLEATQGHLSPEAASALKDEFTRAATEALWSGQLSPARSPTPAIVEKLVHDLTVAKTKELLAMAGLTLPIGPHTVEIGGQPYTRQQLLDRCTARYGGAIRIQAESIALRSATPLKNLVTLGL